MLLLKNYLIKKAKSNKQIYFFVTFGIEFMY